MTQRAGITFKEWEQETIGNDRELAIACLQHALQNLHNPEERAACLLSIRAVAEACGGMAAIASEAGLSRESLYRALSPKGNPTLKTLAAILKVMNLRLTVTAATSQKEDEVSTEAA